MVKPRSFKLIYFDVQWRCEPIRILFHYFGQDFEDVRITNDEWAQMKPDAPFEQLPLLELDGGKKTLSESLSIMRYLSKTLGPEGFIGKTKSDSAKVDMFAYACNDLYIPIYFYNQAKAGNEGMINLEGAKIQFELSAQRFLRSVEKQLKSHRQKYLAQYITWADIMVMYMIYMLEKQDETMIGEEEYPYIRQFCKRMRELEQIKDYVAEQMPSKILKED
ncbi:hypothetical protein PENTCL1PPCAC_19816 [Pristionchus entomophagus]|uniref:Glutathione S-transferase n=1 Tax=Pristionchus entomophagus TaxID=358040 RepID=A0AAV5TTN6_9BILA|nr:hypothetical protein PENTCL1PPCAC_19816 [Pristionchus entomophagus]